MAPVLSHLKNKDMEIKDYLHLYIGCDVMVTEPESAGYKCKLIGAALPSKSIPEEDERTQAQVFESDGDDGYEGKGCFWVSLMK